MITLLLSQKENTHVVYLAAGVDITSFVETCLFEAPFVLFNKR